MSPYTSTFPHLSLVLYKWWLQKLTPFRMNNLSHDGLVGPGVGNQAESYGWPGQYHHQAVGNWPNGQQAFNDLQDGDYDDEYGELDQEEDFNLGGVQEDYKPYIGDDDAHTLADNGNATSTFTPTIFSEVAYAERVQKRIKDEGEQLMLEGAQTDYPVTQGEQLLWIQKLYDAFKNVKDIVDKPCKNGKPAQSAQRLGGNYYPPEAIELACWEILVSRFLASISQLLSISLYLYRVQVKCRDAQLGVQLTEVYTGYRHEGGDFHETFADRMNCIIDALKVCSLLLHFKVSLIDIIQ